MISLASADLNSRHRKNFSIFFRQVEVEDWCCMASEHACISAEISRTATC